MRFFKGGVQRFKGSKLTPAKNLWNLFLTNRSALCPNSSEKFLFKVNRQDQKKKQKPKKRWGRVQPGLSKIPNFHEILAGALFELPGI